jgi:hypothetical protein
MGILNDKANKFKREQLRELLNQCTQEEIAVFNQMYVSIDKIPDNKMDHAYQQCLNTIGTREYTGV